MTPPTDTIEPHRGLLAQVWDWTQLGLVVAGIAATVWAISNLDPYGGWKIPVFLGLTIMPWVRYLVTKRWSRLKAGWSIAEVLQDEGADERPRLLAATRCLMLSAYLAFLYPFVPMLIADAEVVRLAVVAIATAFLVYWFVRHATILVAGAPKDL